MFYGKCTILKMSHHIKGSIGMINNVQLNFKSQGNENLPILKIFFTSMNNSYGALWQQWLEGKVYDVTVDPKENIYRSISLNRQIRKKLPEKSYCSQQNSYYECIAQK